MRSKRLVLTPLRIWYFRQLEQLALTLAGQGKQVMVITAEEQRERKEEVEFLREIVQLTGPLPWWTPDPPR